MKKKTLSIMLIILMLLSSIGVTGVYAEERADGQDGSAIAESGGQSDFVIAETEIIAAEADGQDGVAIAETNDQEGVVIAEAGGQDDAAITEPAVIDEHDGEIERTVQADAEAAIVDEQDSEIAEAIQADAGLAAVSEEVKEAVPADGQFDVIGESNEAEIQPAASSDFTALDASDFIISGNKLTAYNGTDVDVIIPEGVVIIGAGVFKNKTAVTSVTIPSSVQIIEDEAFYGSGLTSVTIPDSVLALGYDSHKQNNQEYARLDVNTSYSGAFTDCNN
ncbi:MAG: leucine-rich repeat protein, partial [Clostridiales Family XIII bacterium]|nr:leucine-rich repeat protein [Clostridiales Family XIII bacterium]